jgi:hypothetical protein
VSNKGITKLVAKSPLIEELLISYYPEVGGDIYEVIGRACLRLKRLMLKRRLCDLERGPLGLTTMRELRCLTIVMGDITTEELLAIVESCPNLDVLLSHLTSYHLRFDSIEKISTMSLDWKRQHSIL